MAALHSLLCWPESSIVVTTAPGGRQVQSLLGAEIAARFAQFRLRFGEDSVPAPNTTSWFMDREKFPKWYWTGFATSADTAQEHATRFVGFHAKKILTIFDEAGGVERPIWTAADGLMTERGASQLVIGNPTDPTSEFAACWNSPDWHCISISAFDCPNLQPDAKENAWGVTRDWVESMIRRYGEGSWPVESKVYGRFPKGAKDTLISLGDVQAALLRPRDPTCPHAVADLGLGVDVARFGDDATFLCATCRRCRSILETAEHFGQDTQWTAGATQAMARRLGLHPDVARQVSIDDTGVGGGVTDRLREEGWRVNAENFGERPRWERQDAERFANRRAELWWGVREWIPTACLAELPIDMHDQLRADLTSIKYKYRGDQSIQLEPKADQKKRIGASPDLGDALALSLAGHHESDALLLDYERGLKAKAAAVAASAPRVGDADRDAPGYGARVSAKAAYDAFWR